MRHLSIWMLLGICFLMGASCGKEPEQPKPVAVKGITLNATSLSLTEGETADLIATISPKDADNKTVLWSTSNGSVASVNNGKVTAIKAGLATITAKSDDGGYTASCSLTVSPATIEVTSISLSKIELSLEEDESETLIATITPDNATDKTVAWSSSDGSIVSVSGTGIVTGLKPGAATITASCGGKTATCEVTVKATYSQPEAIDLGLPSGLKWASFNLGARKPEEYGYYYAWGETEIKSNYNWETYKWCKGSYNTLIKYNNLENKGTVDNKSILEEADDVAHVKLGEKWRMPTYEEVKELLKHCTSRWMTRNGVDGMEFIGPNGKSIFLPAAGSMEGTDLKNTVSLGAFWTSSSSPENGIPQGAWELCYNSTGLLWCGNPDRCYGLSVRPVSD